MGAQTLFDKIWQQHLVHEADDGTALIYIDRHLVHEVTSPQAFEGLRMNKRTVRRPDLTLAVADHNVPTSNRAGGIDDPQSRIQVETLAKNCAEFNIAYFDMDDERQGIVHIIGPEQGFTLPGMTIVCGDSHTSTHGAFGALAFGIGTSEVEHVLASQTLIQRKPQNMRVTINGALPHGYGAKDLILTIIGKIGTAGGSGKVIEFAGEAIEALTMEGRMTLCNMAIEGGARAGLIAPDQKTYDYINGRPMAPKGDEFAKAMAYWQTLPSDEGAEYDHEVAISIDDLDPQVTWGTSPEDVVAITDIVPNPADFKDKGKQVAAKRSLDYMQLTPGTKMQDIQIDKVFIGSCTNGRIEDLRLAAALTKTALSQGKKVAAHVDAMIVPGSGLVKAQAEKEGLHEIFIEAGFDWREPGCSMCLAMNDDRLKEGERCASTSNRNFEGRQGRGGRTHLVSPAMAVASAFDGRLSDPRDYIPTLN